MALNNSENNSFEKVCDYIQFLKFNDVIFYYEINCYYVWTVLPSYMSVCHREEKRRQSVSDTRAQCETGVPSSFDAPSS
jgi:hypothetical protein